MTKDKPRIPEPLPEDEAPYFWRPKDAARNLGIKTGTFWDLTRKPGFPEAMRPTSRITLFDRKEVLAWFRSQAGRPPRKVNRGRTGSPPPE